MRAKRNMVTSYSEDEFDLRRGPWTLEEDMLLIHYVSCHGEGRWNLLAKSSGLKRTGKSCRLRWLNYLKPDIKRGNITPQEQLLILELHSKWGNRWSKIAQHLPGRTDNEIKNYWRTRVQKQARHLKIDLNSKKFVEELQHFWMPRLLEKVEQSSSSSSSSSFCSSTSTTETEKSPFPLAQTLLPISPPSPHPLGKTGNTYLSNLTQESTINSSLLQFPENSEYQTSPKENTTSTSAYYSNSLPNECYYVDVSTFDMMGSLSQPGMGFDDMSASGFQLAEADWVTDDLEATFWNMDELWQFRK